MIKRFMIVTMLAGSVAVTGAANAGCDASSAGHRAGATVQATEVGGDGVVTVTLDARWVDACDDGTLIYNDDSSDKVPVAIPVPIIGAPTTLTITGDRECTAQTGSDWDPFGFAVGVHDTGKDPLDGSSPHLHTTCNIDITWSGFTQVWTPDPGRSGLVGDGVRVAISKQTNHENGAVFVDGVEYRAHGALIGTMWTGVGGDA